MQFLHWNVLDYAVLCVHIMCRLLYRLSVCIYCTVHRQLYIVEHSMTRAHWLKGGNIVKVLRKDTSKQWLVQCINTGQEGYISSSCVAKFNSPSPIT